MTSRSFSPSRRFDVPRTCRMLRQLHGSWRRRLAALRCLSSVGDGSVPMWTPPRALDRHRDRSRCGHGVAPQQAGCPRQLCVASCRLRHPVGGKARRPPARAGGLPALRSRSHPLHISSPRPRSLARCPLRTSQACWLETCFFGGSSSVASRGRKDAVSGQCLSQKKKHLLGGIDYME